MVVVQTFVPQVPNGMFCVDVPFLSIANWCTELTAAVAMMKLGDQLHVSNNSDCHEKKEDDTVWYSDSF